MKQEITLESLYNLLSGFIIKQETFNAIMLDFKDKQEAFNSKQEAFNSKQEAFNSKQEAFNSKQEAFNSKQESFNTRLEDRLDSIQEEERQNHNVTHRMIMQAFGHISDIKGELIDQKEPWMRHKK